MVGSCRLAACLSKTIYYWRVKTRDAFGNETGFSGHTPDGGGFGIFDTNRLPLASTTLYTHDTDASAGDTNPMILSATTNPHFSAIYNDPDTGDIANA